MVDDVTVRSCVESTYLLRSSSAKTQSKTCVYSILYHYVYTSVIHLIEAYVCQADGIYINVWYDLTKYVAAEYMWKPVGEACIGCIFRLKIEGNAKIIKRDDSGCRQT